MLSRAELCKTTVCSNENALAGLRGMPQVQVLQSLIGRSTYVEYIVTEFPQMLHSHAGDILVDENSHPQPTTSSIGVICSSARLAA